MPYHIDEENSELVFEVREGNKLVIKLKSNTGGGGSDIYLIKTGDETTPTEKNTFSSLRILKEIEQLHETILQEVGSDLSVWEIKQAENGEKYISTKYDVVTEKGITAYASGIKDAGSIVDGIPFDNKTIWFNPETGVVEVIGGTGGGSFDSSKMWELLLSDTDEQINISHLADALSGYATEDELRKKWTQDDNKISNWDTAFSWGDHSKAGYAHLANEETFSDIKHFTQGLTVGEGKHKLYEKDGVVYLDGDLAVTGGLTAYALGDTDISTIMDGVVVDGTTIKKENGQLVAVGGSGSSFDKSAMWTALSEDTTEQINISHLTDALSGYSVKSTTLAGYGITDAYTKSEADNKYLLKTSYTAADVLDKLLTVDGSGSGLDADLLDGLNSNYFFRYIASHARDAGLSSQYVKVVPKSEFQRSSFYITRYHNGQVGTFIFSPNLYNNTSRILTQIGGNENQYWVWYYDSSNKCYYLELNGNSNFFIIGYENNITTSVVDSPSGVSNHSKMLANIEDNVASATKLQTPRNIWGRPFDGTANIDGYFRGLYTYGGFFLYPGVSNGEAVRIEAADSSGNWVNKGITLLQNGNVGIGTDTPSQKLQVAGNILATGGITCFSSDARAKTIIKEISLSLNEIAESPIIRFKWNGWKIKDDGKTHIGGIAQYVQKLLPECVLDTDDFLNLDYSTTAYIYSVQTARHLLTYETRTDKKIRKLEKRIKYLERKLKNSGYDDAKIVS